jgi:DNA-binding transcriptional ArsR family regulator
MTDEPLTEDALLEQGLAKLREVLGEKWTVTQETDPYVDEPVALAKPDTLLQISTPDNNNGRVLVEVELNPQPSRIRDRLLPKIQLLRRIQGGQASALLIAPWISPQTADLLDTWGVNYLDLTGNVALRMDRPGLIIRVPGAAKDPRPRAQQRGLRGPRAGSLVRVLADVRPPYRVQNLAEAAGVSQPYVSRLLDSLEDQGLIRRRLRRVESVDWEALLRLRAEQAPLLKINDYVGYLAPNGIDAFEASLPKLSTSDLTTLAVTGSAAASAVAPLAIGGQAMLYAGSLDLIKRFGLLPVHQAPDLILLRPKDPAPFRERRVIKGVPHVALSQLVLDCLSGPGRLPAAGEAVLDTMRGHEDEWRKENLDDLDPVPA